MKKWIEKLIESPCYQCGCIGQCSEKVGRSPKLQEIQDAVFPNAEFDFHDCGIWISLNAPEMIEVDEW